MHRIALSRTGNKLVYANFLHCLQRSVFKKNRPLLDDLRLLAFRRRNTCNPKLHYLCCDVTYIRLFFAQYRSSLLVDSTYILDFIVMIRNWHAACIVMRYKNNKSLNNNNYLIAVVQRNNKNNKTACFFPLTSTSKLTLNGLPSSGHQSFYTSEMTLHLRFNVHSLFQRLFKPNE
ncbi:hypothetical protein V5J35_002649 [Endozoicomonas sp. NE40]|uniref:Uncharacterized protein n=1 Tax=Endozoicomonas lisbonensis TaxID=3120522 RepID=A0ABV2SI93_9GAMM